MIAVSFSKEKSLKALLREYPRGLQMANLNLHWEQGNKDKITWGTREHKPFLGIKKLRTSLEAISGTREHKGIFNNKVLPLLKAL